MIEKNIIGVYRLSEQYPVFQHQDHTKKRIEAVKYATEAQQTGDATQVTVGKEDTVEDWRVFSERLKQRKKQQSEQEEQAEQDQQEAQEERWAEAQHRADEAIQKRVLQLQMLTGVKASAERSVPQQLHQRLASLPVVAEHVHEAVYEAPTLLSNAAVAALCVGDVMTRRVTCMSESASLEQVMAICWQRGISGLPVLNSQQELVGVISIKDVMKHVLTAQDVSSQWGGQVLKSQLTDLQRPVSQYMTREVITVSPDAPLQEACRLMQQHRIRRVIVTTAGQVKGLFSTRDAVKVLAAANLQIENPPPA